MFRCTLIYARNWGTESTVPWSKGSLKEYSAVYNATLWLICSGVSIRFMGQELTNSSSEVCLTDIGQQPSVSTTPTTPDTVEGDALVCRTTNSTCCRSADGTPGGTGEWIQPNGDLVAGTQMGSLPLLYRNRGTGLVRLNVQPQAEQSNILTGQYCCTIPDNAQPISMQTTLCVTITLGELHNCKSAQIVPCRKA